MIKFRMVRPFVMEMAVFLFAIFVVLFCFLMEDYIVIAIDFNFLTVCLIVILLGYFMFLFSRIINMGVRALFDFVFQKTKNDTYVFLKTLPYVASSFTEKWGHNRETSIGMYYLVQVEKEGNIITLISPSFLNFKEGNVYNITSAFSSRIILSYSENGETDIRTTVDR